MTDSSTTATPQLLRIGCAGLPPGDSLRTYFKRFDLLETDATFSEPPAAATLKRWRREAPERAEFSMLAWQLITHEPSEPSYQRLTVPLPPEARAQAGLFRPTERVRSAWQRTLAAAQALAAEVVVFQTPPAFTPSVVHRDAMKHFFAEVVGAPPTGLRLAWEPRGIWEPPQASALAAQLGLIYVVDPLQLEEPPPQDAGPAAYFRIHSQRITEDALEVLAEAALAYQTAWVVFANTNRSADANRLRNLLATSGVAL